MYDLLEKVGITPVDSYVDLHRDYLLKDEIIEICNVLNVDTGENVPTKADMRTVLRAEVINPFGERKPTTAFSTSEIRNLSRTIDHKQYLDPDDLSDIELERPMEVVVNGETYTIIDYESESAHPEAAYDRYVCLYFGDRKRLMILYGRDPNECHYHASVVLESARNYGPYKRWKKDQYVKEFVAT